MDRFFEELIDGWEFRIAVLTGEIKMHLEDKIAKNPIFSDHDVSIACTTARINELDIAIDRLKRLREKYNLN